MSPCIAGSFISATKSGPSEVDVLERDFERGLKKRLESIFPGCLYLKLDPTAIQGIPDRLVIWQDRWAALELKRSPRAKKQPNQEYYINMMNEWSFAAFVHPGNVEEVLDALQRAFRS
nr:MAG TPA: Nuclease [Caudoviricetes sp.]